MLGCEKGEEWQLALTSGRKPGCERRIVRNGVAISACGRGEEWQLALASGRMPGCVSRVGCFVTYFCGIVCVIVEYWLMTIHCFVFDILCCFVVVLQLLCSLEGVSLFVCLISACFFVGVACVAGSIVAILSKCKRKYGKCRFIGRRRYMVVKSNRTKISVRLICACKRRDATRAISACAHDKGKGWQRAWRMLGIMGIAFCVFLSIHYISLVTSINACENGGEWQLAFWTPTGKDVPFCEEGPWQWPYIEGCE